MPSSEVEDILYRGHRSATWLLSRRPRH